MSKKRSAHLGARTIAPEDIPNVQKTKTQSVLFALPILMVLAGLLFHFSKQRSELHALPIMEEVVMVEGVFERVISYGKKEEKKYFLEMIVDEKSKNIHLPKTSVEQVQTLQSGQVIAVMAAPKISGSQSLWFVSFTEEGRLN